MFWSPIPPFAETYDKESISEWVHNVELHLATHSSQLAGKCETTGLDGAKIGISKYTDKMIVELRAEFGKQMGYINTVKSELDGTISGTSAKSPEQEGGLQQTIVHAQAKFIEI